MDNTASRGRCLLVAVMVTTVAAYGGKALLPLLTTPAARADGDLVRLCAALLLGSAVWAWVACLAAVVDAWRGPRPGHLPGVPPTVRRLVLSACGVTLAAGLAVPAYAVDLSPAGPALAGLPLPDRATAAPPAAPALVEPVFDGIHVVAPGETLSAIAAATLADDAPPEAVEARWRTIHALNRSVIGADPDVIHPGQRLRLAEPPSDATGGPR